MLAMDLRKTDMMYKPQNLKRWTMPENYFGAV
jgi:hypothetical protein